MFPASLLTFLFLALPIAAHSPRALAAPYEGTKVLRVTTGRSTEAIDSLISSLGLERWILNSAPNSHIDVQVPHNLLDYFTTEVKAINSAAGIARDTTTIHHDLGESIRRETEGMFSTSDTLKKRGLTDDSWFDTYHTYDDHQAWLTSMASAFPDNAEIVNSGTSVEGRKINGLKIFGNSTVERPAVILHGAVHAREWVTTMVTEFVAHGLLTGYTNATKHLVDGYDFYVFPTVNPDGLVHSQTEDRLWRKNRSPAPAGSACVGTDINRNWAHKSWNQTEGASTDPCELTYKGPSPGSSPEAAGLAAFLDARAASSAGILLYIDFHSYIQVILSPYGYKCDPRSLTPEKTAEFASMTSGFAAFVRSIYGTAYIAGPSCSTLYQTSGGGVDYAYDNAKAKYAYTIELRDLGKYGFVLPADQIRPTAIETVAGLTFLLENATL